MILWLHLRDACWCPWEPSEKFSYIGDVGLGGDGGFGTFFMPWPRLRLVQGFRKGLHAERQEMGQAPHLHWGLQFGAPVLIPPLGILNILGQGKGIPPADWQTEMLR